MPRLPCEGVHMLFPPPIHKMNKFLLQSLITCMFTKMCPTEKKYWNLKATFSIRNYHFAYLNFLSHFPSILTPIVLSPMYLKGFIMIWSVIKQATKWQQKERSLCFLFCSIIKLSIRAADRSLRSCVWFWCHGLICINTEFWFTNKNYQ